MQILNSGYKYFQRRKLQSPRNSPEKVCDVIIFKIIFKLPYLYRRLSFVRIFPHFKLIQTIFKSELNEQWLCIKAHHYNGINSSMQKK